MKYSAPCVHICAAVCVCVCIKCERARDILHTLSQRKASLPARLPGALCDTIVHTLHYYGHTHTHVCKTSTHTHTQTHMSSSITQVSCVCVMQAWYSHTRARVMDTPGTTTTTTVSCPRVIDRLTIASTLERGTNTLTHGRYTQARTQHAAHHIQ